MSNNQRSNRRNNPEMANLPFSQVVKDAATVILEHNPSLTQMEACELALSREEEDEQHQRQQQQILLTQQDFTPPNTTVQQMPTPPLTQRTGLAGDSLLNLANNNEETPPLPLPPSAAASAPGAGARSSPNQEMTADEIANLLMSKDSGIIYTEEEKASIAACDRGRNTKNYENNLDRLESKFFSTIAEYGGDNLRQLLKIVPSNHSGGRKEDFLFYNIVGGSKSESKLLPRRCSAPKSSAPSAKPAPCTFRSWLGRDSTVLSTTMY